MMIRILLVDDHSLVREGIKQLLEESGEMKVIAETSNGMDAIEKFEKYQPDMAIIDISMPLLDGLESTKRILARYPDAKILILTMHPEEQYAIRTFKAGALGYINKGTNTKDLLAAVKKVAQGKKYIAEEGKDAILLQLLNNKSSQLENLSDRELQILRLISKGEKPREIANALLLSVKTVETYRTRIMNKLGLKTNSALTLFSQQNGLIT
jgi:two-component system invasion response regulator UvrY